MVYFSKVFRQAVSSFASGQFGVPDLSSFVRTRVLAAFFVHRPVLCIVCTCGFYATSGRSVFHLQFQRTALVQLLYRLLVPSETQCDRCNLGAKLSHASHHLPLLHGVLLRASPEPCDAALSMLWSLILRLLTFRSKRKNLHYESRLIGICLVIHDFPTVWQATPLATPYTSRESSNGDILFRDYLRS